MPRRPSTTLAVYSPTCVVKATGGDPVISLHFKALHSCTFGYQEEAMVRWTASLITAVAISGLQVAVAAERKMPKFDIAAACRSSGAVETVAGCTRDEQAARGQLAKLWPQFKKSDQSRCVQMVTDLGPSMSSYVELLTCLQAAKIEKKMPTDPLGPTPAILE
jgi:hypothetical protein